MIWRKTLKSGLHFYENCPPVKILSLSYRSLSSVQNSVHCFITQLQIGIFYAFELLKSPVMWDITEKINFDIPFSCMISRKNFEIRTVFYENGLVRNGSCLTIIAVFLRTGFSSLLYNLTTIKYFFSSLNYCNLH